MSLRFVVSSYPSGASQEGSIGSPDRASKPENVDFYVVLKAKVIAPKNQRPDKIRFRLRRGNDVRYEDGYLITDSRDADAPEDLRDEENFRYTYRTFGQGSRTPRLNWNITKVKGRWQISIANETSNTVQFKVDKRGQIVFLAMHWAEVWPSVRQNPSIIRYPSSGRSIFSLCNGFSRYIYTSLGLSISNKLNTQLAQTVPDRRKGALRFFWAPGPGGREPSVSDASHVAVVINGNQQVDNNHAYGGGPTLRDQNDGVPSHYFGPVTPNLKPQNRTTPELRQLDDE